MYMYQFEIDILLVNYRWVEAFWSLNFHFFLPSHVLIILISSVFVRLARSFGSASNCRSRGCEFKPQPDHTIFMVINHEIISMAILPLSTDSRRAVVTGTTCALSTG